MISALETILRRPRVVLSLMFMMIIAGVYSYLTIPKEARPDIQVPVFYVSIPLQGVSPEDAERLLVKPMEEELRSLDGLKELTGIAAQGFASIIVEFEADMDTEAAARKVREKVDLAKAELPASAEEPIVNEVNLSLFPSIIVGLSGDVPERTLHRHARDLQEDLETIPSVLEVRLSGQREELLEVLIDESKLQSYNVSQGELLSAVNRNNKLVAAGEIDAGKGRFNIKVPGLFENALDVYSLPIKVSDGTVVKLSDVAEIRRTFKDPSRFARFNGKPSITVEVVKRLGSNIIETNQKVRDLVAAKSADWPQTIRTNFALDESKQIFEVLGSLQSSIITAIALVMVVCVAALGTRSAMLVGLAIPTSFMIGFLIVSLLDKTINNMLMFGMVLTVGMLVDGAIVIVEFADRKMAEGMPRREAYIAAAKRMFWPVFSSTATTLAAFLPMLFWPGVPGKFMSNLPTTVVIVLTASLMTAMLFLPVLGGLFGRTDASDSTNLKRLAATEKGDLTELGGFTGAYIGLLSRLIRHPLKVLIVAGMTIAGIFMVFAKHNNGVTFFVETEPQQALIYVRARGNLSVHEKLRLTRGVEDIIRAIDGIETIATQAGSTSGGGIGSGAGLDQPKDAIGQMTIELEPFGTRRPGKQIIQDIRDRTADLPGIIVEVKQRENGPASGKDIRLQVRADSVDVANATATMVRKHLQNNTTGLIDIEDETPLPGIEWTLRVNREEAGRYGADVVSVGAMVQLVTNGVLVGTYRPDDSRDEVDIRVRLPENERALSRLDTLRLQTANGLVPLGNFV
ncbi:MAG: efflux RND transporter permease subunit, partial [Hyphomicrobiales bacterium]|nr:efflux RND transporter permease subunit [Hyphomicrobiales bacterium]